jgi:hypothetical protein
LTWSSEEAKGGEEAKAAIDKKAKAKNNQEISPLQDVPITT